MMKVLSNPARYQSILVDVQIVFWWINRALNFMKPVKCNCIRTVKVQNKTEYDYYDVGKVFKFKNVIRAIKLDSKDAVKS